VIGRPQATNCDHSRGSIGVLWAQYGPYHFARAAALQKLAAPEKVRALELADQSCDYQWDRSGEVIGLITLCRDGVAEKLPFWEVFRRARKTFAELKLKVCILPGYAPKQSLAALLAAKSLGIRAVMMNESHAGTARARGSAAWVKRRLVGLFDAALVGGNPQKRYFASLGLPSEKIFTGYDAVDNDYFARRAEEVRSKRSVFSNQYDLPEHYFLSLGRFVAKKNLETLIRAYHQYLRASPLKLTHLVMVGSGDEETRLRWLCHHLDLIVYEKRGVGVRNTVGMRSAECGAWSEKDGRGGNEDANRKTQDANTKPGVHFYGFRQIEENPVFYSLADAFILPSLWEEWGLVVNEAMASGLPVAVSETAGCAEDLLEACSLERTTPDERMRIDQSGLALKLRRNGFVFSPNSVEELSRALLVFEGSAGLRASMGAESRRIVERFSCENFARSAMRTVEAAQLKSAYGRSATAPIGLS
jgi:glycosyltransferase involved in cell wall biosynthesis